MKLPQLVDYRDAMIRPDVSLLDPVLRRSTPRLNPLGLPSPISGGFALTFDVRVDSDRYAVRCFHKDRLHLKERYTEVASFVRRSGLPFLVEVAYLTDGIRVGSGIFPIVCMRWVEAARLDDWIEDHLRQSTKIEQVRRNIAGATLALRQHDAAHGDLQHGNILVQPGGSIRLVDYDGMYLPTLRDYGSAEEGNRNYQHPDRGQQYDSSLDVFAAAVIDLSLAAVSHDSTLWRKFNQGSGERLLFSADDFADPASSELFDRLLRAPALAEPARRLQAACGAPVTDVPAIIEGKLVPSTKAGASAKSPRSAVANVLEATDRTTLLTRQGDYVTVIGRVDSVARRPDRRGGLITFINFGQYWRGDFTLVAWDRVGRDLDRVQGDPAGLAGKWIAVTGLLNVYRHPRRQINTPQIELDSGRAISVLTATEAQRRLVAAAATSRSARTAAAAPRSGTASPRTATPGPLLTSHSPSDVDSRLSRLYSSPKFNSKLNAYAPAPPTTQRPRPAPPPKHATPSTSASPPQTPPPAAGAPWSPGGQPSTAPWQMPPQPGPWYGPPGVPPPPRKTRGNGVLALVSSFLCVPVGVIVAISVLKSREQHTETDVFCAVLALPVALLMTLMLFRAY